MTLDLTDDKSTLVEVMPWCHQATSHYLGQCWPSFMSPYGVTRPQWVKISLVHTGSWYIAACHRVPTGSRKPGKSGKIKFSGKVMESHGTLKNHQNSWKSHGKSHTEILSPSNRNLALKSFASHLVSCIHSNTSDYDLLGEFEANPLVYCYYTPRNEVRGGILDSACLSVCPSVRLSVCLSVNFFVSAL